MGRIFHCYAGGITESEVEGRNRHAKYRSKVTYPGVEALVEFDPKVIDYNAQWAAENRKRIMSNWKTKFTKQSTCTRRLQAAFQFALNQGTGPDMRRDPVFIVLTIVMTLLLLLLFVVYPPATLFITSFRVEEEVSLENYADFFRYSYYYRSMLNSLLLGIVTTVIILVIAFALSYTISKTNLPLKGFLKTASLLPLISPPFIFSLALIIIAGRRGLIYQFLKISPNIYGWPQYSVFYSSSPRSLSM